MLILGNCMLILGNCMLILGNCMLILGNCMLILAGNYNPILKFMIAAPLSMSSSSKSRVVSSQLLSFLDIIRNRHMIIARGELMAMQTFCISGVL
jgi:hypothetical protein